MTTPPGPVATRTGQGVVAGLAGAAAAASLWLVTGGVLDVGGGLLIVAVVVGWLVGGAVAYGAWRGRPHRNDGRMRLLASVLGLAVWLAGTVLMYLYAEVTLPESSFTLPDRLARTPFPAWAAPQFLPLGPVELVIIAAVSWWAAR